MLVYFQHTFYSLFDESVSTYDQLLNLYHFIKKMFYIEETIFLIMGSICYNG